MLYRFIAWSLKVCGFFFANVYSIGFTLWRVCFVSLFVCFVCVLYWLQDMNFIFDIIHTCKFDSCHSWSTAMSWFELLTVSKYVVRNSFWSSTLLHVSLSMFLMHDAAWCSSACKRPCSRNGTQSDNLCPTTLRQLLSLDGNKNGFDVADDVAVAVLPGLILCLHPANERRRYKVTPSLIGRSQA